MFKSGVLGPLCLSSLLFAFINRTPTTYGRVVLILFSSQGKEESSKLLLESLKSHLIKLCPATLDGKPDVISYALQQPNNASVLKTFASDTAVSSLCVSKRMENTGDGLVLEEVYTLELTVAPSKAKSVHSIIFFKSTGVLEESQPMSSQLTSCQINHNSPFESILNYVRHAFLPYSRSLVEAGDSKEGDLAISKIVSGKLGELEVELLRSQQSVDIPLITLVIEKRIAEFVKKQKELGKTPLASDLGALVTDKGFLGALNDCLKEWRKAIMQVTKLTRDVSSGSTLQEVNFWASMERAVHHIYDQRESQEVKFTMSILKESNNFLASSLQHFNKEVGLSEEGKEKDKVHNYSNFLRELPIKSLLAATEINEVKEAIDSISKHVQKIRSIAYPIKRCIGLFHTISRDISAQLKSILSARKLMALSHSEFERIVADSSRVFDEYNGFKTVLGQDLSSLAKKRPEEGVSSVKIDLVNQDMKMLFDRLDVLRKIRKDHEAFRQVVVTTLEHDPALKNSAIESIGAAMRTISAGLDVLVTTKEGQENFDLAVKEYHSKIEQVEVELESKIRGVLEAAKNDANEMFRVCAKFNALFVKPRIQNAIREYQDQLIHTVKNDIELLQTKFKNKYQKSEARRMSKIRDLPPVSGAIIWANQIDRQLRMYQTRVEDVLGKRWDQHTQGKQLKKDLEAFQQRLQPLTLYQQWLEEAQRLEQFEVDAPIFKIESVGRNVMLDINFNRSLITLFKEVRNLCKLSKKVNSLKVPFALRQLADDVKEKYPFAMRLDEAIRMYMRACDRISGDNIDLAPLCAKAKAAVQETITVGVKMNWAYEKLQRYVERLTSQAADFQDHVDDAIVWSEQAKVSLQKLGSCAPEKEAFGAVLQEMQAVVYQLDKKGYSNVGKW